MPVIAVINRKGGSGKSTLATHLAGWCAANGLPVMLGDVDRQQSSLAWLRRRAAAGRNGIHGWAADGKSVLRPPAGVTHVVLDTPGGLRDSELARVVMYADAILMPVCHSAFDLDSAAGCHAELMALPRVASGRCKVAAVGMRLDARTRAAEQVQAWAVSNAIAYAGALRETQAYVRCAEQGLTLFDLPPAKVEADLQQWQPVIGWLQSAWADAAKQDQAAKAVAKPAEAAPPPRPRTLPNAPAVATPSPAVRRTVNAEAQLARLVPQRPPRPQAKPFGWLFAVFRGSN